MSGKGAGEYAGKEIAVACTDHDLDTPRYVVQKMHDNSIQRLDRHPADGIGLAHGPPKGGHGGKFNWEGPSDIVDSELSVVAPAMDEKDPNYVKEESKNLEVGMGGDEQGENAWEELLVGEVEVAKTPMAKDGVARVEVYPSNLFLNLSINRSYVCMYGCTMHVPSNFAYAFRDVYQPLLYRNSFTEIHVLLIYARMHVYNTRNKNIFFSLYFLSRAIYDVTNKF